MTRLTVAIEGAVVNNCVILPGALQMEDEYVPVCWNGDASAILGRASDLQRSGNEITMEIELASNAKGLDLEDNIGGFVFVSPFEAKQHALVKDAISEIVSGRIRAVHLHDLSPMPNFPKKD